ncbi:hypothetical protein C8C83_4506 [Flavobacterium sp. 90]|uniref:hypothetical protein n=1 Tax=unclassified Flavobacterium TaxID=196869 RepID=UPI000EB0CB43|nr:MULTISPECIES: hypothetical protein [unclassified Flavobacterium]RKR05173.1 hypothetical protein C8C82_4847 [Flavobacterium sp. 81]TCK56489.1 hypothetical protein C8C83_4506 [Flavobacterium sp. 90]
MFTNISWSNYIIAVSVLLLIWYLFVGLKFYFFEFKRVISGEQKIKFPHFRNKKGKQFISNSSGENNLNGVISSSYSESFDTLDDTKELSDRLIKAITESIERNLSKEEFENYLRLLLSEYPFVKISALRESINKLIVSESEKYPNFLLTYPQTDCLWDDAI